MKKEFIPYEESLQLKELGFDEPCLGKFIDDGLNFEWFKPNMYMFETHNIKGFEHKNHINSICCVNTQCTRPLYQQAFRWFSDNYSLYVSKKPYINVNGEFLNEYMILNKEGISNGYTYSGYTNDEIDLVCLKKLIENAKNK